MDKLLIVLCAVPAVLVVLVVVAWRRHLRQLAAEVRAKSEAEGAPDQSGSRLVWRPGEGGQQ